MDQTFLNEIIGHEEIKTFFRRELEKGIDGRCYLFEGKKGVGKHLFAEHLARSILKTQKFPHPDYICFSPEGKSHIHSIELLKSLKEEALRIPNQSSHVVIVIDEADRMAINSSQSVLKIFEEPPTTTLFILLTENRHKLLPTILSRCQIVTFKPLKEEEIKRELPDCTPLMIHLAQGSLGKAKEYLEKGLPPMVDLTLNLLAKGKQESLFSLQDQLDPIAAAMDEEGERQESISLFFFIFLAWFRDMHLLQYDVHSEKVFLPHKREELSQALQRGECKPLEKVFQSVQRAKVSFERFTSCRQVLETLFLEIS